MISCLLTVSSHFFIWNNASKTEKDNVDWLSSRHQAHIPELNKPELNKSERQHRQHQHQHASSQSSARESGVQRRKKAAGIMSRDGKFFFLFSFKRIKTSKLCSSSNRSVKQNLWYTIQDWSAHKLCSLLGTVVPNSSTVPTQKTTHSSVTPNPTMSFP